MSENLAVTALKTHSPDEVTEAMRAYLDKNKVPLEELGEADLSMGWGLEDAVVYPPNRGWVVVIWPRDFLSYHFPAAESLSATLATTVSAINVPDGSYWTHRAYFEGRCIDQFCSYPDLWARSKKHGDKLREEWQGDTEACARHFGIAAQLIAPYFIYWPADPDGPGGGKAFPEDRFERRDSWAFADFWLKLGISYPDRRVTPRQVRLTAYRDHLPSTTGSP